MKKILSVILLFTFIVSKSTAAVKDEIIKNEWLKQLLISQVLIVFMANSNIKNRRAGGKP